MCARVGRVVVGGGGGDGAMCGAPVPAQEYCVRSSDFATVSSDTTFHVHLHAVATDIVMGWALPTHIHPNNTSTLNAVVRMLMKGAAMCDKHAELQKSVSQQEPECAFVFVGHA